MRKLLAEHEGRRVARAGRTGRQLPPVLVAQPAQGRYRPGQALPRGRGEGLRDSAKDPGRHGTRSQVWTVRAAGQVGTAWAGASPLASRACVSWPCPRTARGSAPGPAYPHPPQVLVISSMAGCEPTWLGDTSPGLGGPRAIGLLLVTLSKVVQVAHIARLHAHEARETLHVIIPGGSEVRGEGWGQRLQTKAKERGWALTWRGPPAAEPRRE